MIDSMSRGRGKAALYPTVSGSVFPVPDFQIDVNLAISKVEGIRPELGLAVRRVTQGETLAAAAREAGVSKRDVHRAMEVLRRLLRDYEE
jgi:hypothetical protein